MRFLNVVSILVTTQAAAPVFPAYAYTRAAARPSRQRGFLVMCATGSADSSTAARAFFSARLALMAWPLSIFLCSWRWGCLSGMADSSTVAGSCAPGRLVQRVPYLNVTPVAAVPTGAAATGHGSQKGWHKTGLCCEGVREKHAIAARGFLGIAPDLIERRDNMPRI